MEIIGGLLGLVFSLAVLAFMFWLAALILRLAFELFMSLFEWVVDTPIGRVCGAVAALVVAWMTGVIRPVVSWVARIVWSGLTWIGRGCAAVAMWLWVALTWVGSTVAAGVSLFINAPLWVHALILGQILVLGVRVLLRHYQPRLTDFKTSPNSPPTNASESLEPAPTISPLVPVRYLSRSPTKGNPMLVPRYIHGKDSDDVLHAERLNGGHVLLVGPRGTGKTTIARKAFPPEDVLFMQVTGALYPESLTVTHLPSEKGFSSVKGILLRAVLYGKVLILDEINAAGEDALTPLREAMSGATDRSVTIENCHPEMIDELRTEMDTRDLSSQLEVVESTVTVHAAPGFMVIGCLNENVFGKRATGLADPLLDRFSLRVHVHLNRGLVVGAGVNTVGLGLWTWGQRNPKKWQPSLRELLDFTRHCETHSRDFAASNLLGRLPPEACPLVRTELAELIGVDEENVRPLKIDDEPAEEAA